MEGGRSTEEEFNPKEFSSPTEHYDRTTPAATSAGPLKTSNKSQLPKFCIFKITKWIIRWRSGRDRRRVFKQQQMGFSTFDAKVLVSNVQRMFSKRTGSLGSPPEKSVTSKPTLCVFWVYVLNTCSFGLRHSFVLTSLSKYYPLICWHYLQTQQGLHNVRQNQHHYQTVTMIGRSLMPFQSPLCSPPPTHLLTNYGSCIMCVNIRQCTTF